MGLIMYHIRRFRGHAVEKFFLYSSNIHNTKPKTRKNRCHQRIKRQYTPKSDDDPAGTGFLNSIILTAEFTILSKLGCFAFLWYSVGCHSPPLVLHFQISKIMKWRTSQMSKFHNRINYRKKYPGLSDEIINVLQKSDRKMEYQQYDLKVDRYKIDYDEKVVTYIPSREDSYVCC